MTFWEQNSLSQSFQLLDKAFHSGINFFDSAEILAHGRKEEARSILDIGFEAVTSHAIASSLPQRCACRLTILTCIKFIGLIAMFLCLEKLSMIRPKHFSISIQEQLTALDKAVTCGKIRYIGPSNETPYGLMKFLQIAEAISIHTRIISVQNSYNLLCRNFDSGMAECCHHERQLKCCEASKHVCPGYHERGWSVC
ncbi:uncharacterized protein LOC127259296 isoform X2 [Andrographis paniculata]|uniref:uncharacterized protein LOC127259296 isoform X2 n=1 Tax=Andrographis paniculata TaxID=175694 RepID=UPI0021E7C85A|nr:uncharacterized protein LOC127259296 isoform X2 [Andrographis paniculata]